MFYPALMLLCAMSPPGLAWVAPDPQAIEEVAAGKRTVANAAWWGFDPMDSTRYLQAAITSKASTVIIPNMGQDWIVRPIFLRSNLELVFEEGVVVTAKKGDYFGKHDSVFTARDIENVTLKGYGATIRMHKDDYTQPYYPKSQHRMGVNIRGCNNVQVLGLTIRDTGGDGIYIGRGSRGLCEGVVIKDVVCDNNYRQGISVISAKNLLIENSVFKNTSGTLPMAGIDFEPNQADERLEQIVVRNCVFDGNEYYGVTINLKPLTCEAEVSIHMENILIRGSRSGFSVKARPEDHPTGTITLRNAVIEDVARNAIRVEHIIDQDTLELSFEDCILHNVATDAPDGGDHPHTSVPIFLEGFSHIARVNLRNVVVADARERPSLYVGVTKPYTSDAFAAIQGDLHVINPYGPQVRWGRRAPNEEALQGIRLQVHEMKAVQVEYDRIISLEDYRLPPLTVSADTLTAR